MGEIKTLLGHVETGCSCVWPLRLGINKAELREVWAGNVNVQVVSV